MHARASMPGAPEAIGGSHNHSNKNRNQNNNNIISHNNNSSESTNNSNNNRINNSNSSNNRNGSDRRQPPGGVQSHRVRDPVAEGTPSFSRSTPGLCGKLRHLLNIGALVIRIGVL